MIFNQWQVFGAVDHFIWHGTGAETSVFRQTESRTHMAMVIHLEHVVAISGWFPPFFICF